PETAFIAAGTGAQVCKLLGGDPYALPDPLPALVRAWRSSHSAPAASTTFPAFRTLSLEQQASVVEIWFRDTRNLADAAKVTHPLYCYIEGNIRAGAG